MAKRRKAIENRAKHLLEYVQGCMETAEVQKIECPFSHRHPGETSERRWGEPGLLPVEYMRTPEPPPPPTRQDRDCSRDQGRKRKCRSAAGARHTALRSANPLIPARTSGLFTPANNEIRYIPGVQAPHIGNYGFDAQ